MREITGQEYRESMRGRTQYSDIHTRNANESTTARHLTSNNTHHSITHTEHITQRTRKQPSRRTQQHALGLI